MRFLIQSTNPLHTLPYYDRREWHAKIKQCKAPFESFEEAWKFAQHNASMRVIPYPEPRNSDAIRLALAECGTIVGGSVSSLNSDEFLLMVPKEVRSAISKLRGTIDALVRIQSDESEKHLIPTQGDDSVIVAAIERRNTSITHKAQLNILRDSLRRFCRKLELAEKEGQLVAELMLNRLKASGLFVGEKP